MSEGVGGVSPPDNPIPTHGTKPSSDPKTAPDGCPTPISRPDDTDEMSASAAAQNESQLAIEYCSVMSNLPPPEVGFPIQPDTIPL